MYKRFPTREVRVGDIGIGGRNPIRVQSMTTSDTCDTKETVRQILELSRAGCEIVRLTVPGMKDAENLINIRNELKKENCTTPLVADIHFTPTVALKVVEYVEKVRINPGNFADKKKFQEKEYTDKEYSLELERIAEVFSPLVRRCRELGVAMRIGTNHGSLSDRIMNRFGDTPLGMVESALEFIRIAETEGFLDIVVSMKASNPQVMVSAYRLLVSRFKEDSRNFPLHLGVTEAGDGKDGRIKSAIGIGTLLDDGIGDTIRVSLTEDSIYEIPVAKELVRKYNSGDLRGLNFSEKFAYREFRKTDNFERVPTNSIPVGQLRIGESYPVRVESQLSTDKFSMEEIYKYLENKENKNNLYNHEILYIEIDNKEKLEKIIKLKKESPGSLPLSIRIDDINLLDEYHSELQIFEKICLPLSIFLKKPEKWKNKDNSLEISVRMEELDSLETHLLPFDGIENIMFSLESPSPYIFSHRKFLSILGDKKFPILLSYKTGSLEEEMLDIARDLGSLLLDGIGNCIRITGENIDPGEALEFSFDVLQAARLRTTKTEFISCPSCGRTLFNLQDTTARIKSKTGHLKGVKIAIMGCIVNGPGEMADADFGYVGAGPGKVHLYKGKEIVSKNIPSVTADEKLIELIKESGMWTDP